MPVGVGLLGLLIDQGSKTLVRATSPLCTQFPVVSCPRSPLVGPFAVVRVENAGTGFSFLRTPTAALVLALLGCALLVLYWIRLHRLDALLGIGIGLQLGGAFGNLIDRLRFGAVTDFINYAPTKTFNLADVLLLSGVLVILVALLRQAIPKRSALRVAQHRPDREGGVP